MSESLKSALQEARAALLNPAITDHERLHVVKVVEGALDLIAIQAKGVGVAGPALDENGRDPVTGMYGSRA